LFFVILFSLKNLLFEGRMTNNYSEDNNSNFIPFNLSSLNEPILFDVNFSQKNEKFL
jgi:hypothetical protein